MKAKPVGTRRFTRNGYVQIKTAQGQRRWPFEHRVVWETAHGPIPKGAYLHHLNGVPDDNRLENLVLAGSNGEHHRRYHREAHAERMRHVGLAGRGRPKTPEHRAAIATALTGYERTAEHRAKIGAAQRGKKRGPMSPERRARIAAGLHAHFHPDG